MIQLTQSTHIIKTLLEPIYHEFASDDSPTLQDFIPKGIWFILYKKREIAGLITLQHLNNITWVPHIYIFEQFRGNGSEKWGLQVADYMRENFGAKKFLVFTPYIAAKKYAQKMGFKQIAILTDSIKKNGQLLDQYIMEMN